MALQKSAEASLQELLEATDEMHGTGAFIDELLLSIIEAHPDRTSSRSSLSRLNAARRALLGDSGAARLKRHPRDRDALLHMAELYMDDRGGAFTLSPNVSVEARVESNPVGSRPVAALAKEAALKFRCSSARTLQNAFGANKLSLCLALIHQSDVAPSLQRQSLQQVRDILALWHIPSKFE